MSNSAIQSPSCSSRTTTSDAWMPTVARSSLHIQCRPIFRNGFGDSGPSYSGNTRACGAGRFCRRSDSTSNTPRHSSRHTSGAATTVASTRLSFSGRPKADGESSSEFLRKSRPGTHHMGDTSGRSVKRRRNRRSFQSTGRGLHLRQPPAPTFTASSSTVSTRSTPSDRDASSSPTGSGHRGRSPRTAAQSIPPSSRNSRPWAPSARPSTQYPDIASRSRRFRSIRFRRCASAVPRSMSARRVIRSGSLSPTNIPARGECSASAESRSMQIARRRSCSRTTPAGTPASPAISGSSPDQAKPGGSPSVLRSSSNPRWKWNRCATSASTSVRSPTGRGVCRES